MKTLLAICFSIVLGSCTPKSDLAVVVENKPELDIVVKKQPELKAFVDSLKSTPFVYKKKHSSDLMGHKNEQLIGYTNRYPPKGNYDRKEITIGKFNADAYVILDSLNDERKNGEIYFCYFSPEQKNKFEDFYHFYRNMIAHQKIIPRVNYINNTAIIKLIYGGG